MAPGGLESLLFLQSPSGLALYAGGWGGAARSLDGGNTWSPIDGVPAGAVYALAGQADPDRAVVYISTEAGMGASSRSAQSTVSMQVMAGGTYGLPRRLLRPRVYLPIVLRRP